jgi:pyridoxine kinase
VTIAERPEALPAVIVISSHVVRGTVGNRAAVFALETLGFPVWALPTITLPWHPGHGRATRLVPDEAGFCALVDDLCQAPWLGEVGGILTGYLGGAHQAAPIAKLIRSVKSKNADAIYLCDPVIGDAGGLYVPEATAIGIRDQLLPLADIATPNRFELQWLTGQSSQDRQNKQDRQDNQALITAAENLGPKTVVTTSAHAMMTGSTGNLLVSAAHTIMAEHRHVDGPSNGLGDLTSALFLARTLFGQSAETALKQTTASVFEVMARAAKRGANELMLAADAASLAHPMAMVQMRRIMSPKPKVPA